MFKQEIEIKNKKKKREREANCFSPVVAGAQKTNKSNGMLWRLYRQTNHFPKVLLGGITALRNETQTDY